MYKSIKINNFKGIKQLEIKDFKRVNLFVGRNDSCKTTILEALFLLTGSTNPQLPINTNSFRGIHTVNDNILRGFFHKLDTKLKIEISGKLDNPREKRKLKIRPHTESTLTMSANMGNEEMTRIGNRYSETTQVINGLILEYLSTQGKNRNSKGKWITSEITFGKKGIELKPPKNYIETLKGIFVSPNVIEVGQSQRFDELQTKKQIHRVIKVLEQIDPSIINLTLGIGGIIKCDVGFAQTIPINSLGRGLNKLLSIMLAIPSAENGVVLIDEIENGLSYLSQRKLWDVIFEFAKEYNVQIFASTHSIECVRALSESHAKLEKGKDNIRLFRMERKNGITNPIKYDYKLLEASIDSGWEIR